MSCVKGRIPKFSEGVTAVNLPTASNGDAGVHWIIAAGSLGSNVRSTFTEY